jgi:hypothetical protein
MSSNHFYFQFEDKLRDGIIPKVTVELLNFYSNKGLSRKKWIKEPDFIVNYKTDINNKDSCKVSKPISYGIISKYLYKNYYFSPEDFDLFRYECFWLDFTIDIQIDFHKFDPGTTTALEIELPQQQMYGDRYPINLRINREGHLYSSMQTALIARIISLRQKLVIQSDLALLSDWVFDLRSLIGDVISLVDITLHQFYNKAEYDPLPHWSFNMEKVGEKFGRRFRDKLKWIGQITGNPLDDARDELSSFHALREIRNHMMHFDPPSLAVPLEEAAIWLNQILDIAFLIKKIRDKIGVNNSTSVLNFMLQKEVVFVPRPPFVQRLPLNSRENGYLCSCWPNEIDNAKYELYVEHNTNKLLDNIQIASSSQISEAMPQCSLTGEMKDSLSDSSSFKKISKNKSTSKGFGKKSS